MTQSYAFIPLIAFFLNVFLLTIFVSVRKNQIIRSFVVFLAFMSVWTAGSFLMRTQFLGLTSVWYHLSLVGIWLGVIGMDNLICRFANTRMGLAENAMALLIVVMLAVNVFTGAFLAPPEVVATDDGVKFVYGSMTIGTYAMYALLALCFAFIGAHVVSCLRHRTVSSAQMRPLVIGTIVLILGNVAFLFPPFEGIPIDIVSGAIFSVSVFISLYYRHLFSLTLALSRKTFTIVVAVGLVLFVMYASPLLASWASTLPEPLGSNSVSVVAVIAVLWVAVMYVGLEKMSEKLFLREYNARAKGLQEYHDEVSRSLEVAQVAEMFCKQIMSDLRGVRGARLCVVDSRGGLVVAASSSAFEVGHEAIAAKSAIVDWLTARNEPVFMDELVRSVEYRALWEEEKRRLDMLNAHCVVPMLDDDELLGAAILTFDSPGKRLSLADTEHLIGLAMLTSFSLRNSLLYERVARDARTDDMTGLLNRKYFLARLDQEHASNPHEVLSLMILNVDDFKLYNQLYGERAGNEALRRIANVLSTMVPAHCLAARLGGKEFAVMMPRSDMRTAHALAENLQRQVYDLNRTPDNELGALKIITMSIGICAIPFGASNTKQLVTNADMAVYQVKQHGKNGIKAFSVGEVKEGARPEDIDRKKTYSSYESTIYALAAAIDAKDHYTFTHSEHVSYYASELARAYGMDDDTVEIVREAGLLHDIGKIGIPESVLNKTDRLTLDEYEIMKRHPENAVSIIRHLPSLDYVIPAVLGHHERWDGRGYPRQLSGEDIPLGARILCIADCFDAITTKRCYQEPRSLETALQIIEEGKGAQFDPNLADLFIREVRAGRIQLQDNTRMTA